jgi:outer membrane biogenesis lipoprotein LolB
MRSRFAALVILLMLGGCAATQPTVPTPETAITAAYVANFAITARVSVRVGEKRDTVKLDWTRRPPDESIKIFTPFGAQVADISANRDGATMRYPNAANTTNRNTTETLSAATVADLTSQAMGVRIDTAILARWVQGLDLKGQANASSLPDSANAPAWTVEAEDFRLIDGAKVATRVTAISGDTVVRVVIDEFRKL